MSEDIITNVQSSMYYSTPIKELVETAKMISETWDNPFWQGVLKKVGTLINKELDFQLEYQEDNNSEYRRSKAKGPAEVKDNVKPLKGK
jgi:hypothetical protein